MCQQLKPSFGVFFIRVFFENRAPWRGDVGPMQAYYAVAMSEEHAQKVVRAHYEGHGCAVCRVEARPALIQDLAHYTAPEAFVGFRDGAETIQAAA